MDIDLRTLSLAVVIAYIIQAFAIASLYYLENKKYRGIGWWMLGSILPAIGLTLMLFRDVPPIESAIIILSNTLILSGCIFIYIGIKRFLDKRENLRLVIPFFLLFIVLFLYFTYVSNDITIRTAIFSVSHAFVLFLIVSALLEKTPRSIKASVYFIAAVESFLAAFGLFRAGYVLFISPVDTFYSATLLQTLTFIFYFVCGFLLTIGLIIMVNQRLNADVAEAKGQFELFFKTSPDGILISRMDDGTVVDMNEAFTDITGFGRNEVIGSGTSDVNMWKDPARRPEIFEEIKKNGYCENFETVLLRKDGREITILVSARIFTLQDVSCVLSVIRDITDRKRAEEALQQANRKLNLLSSITRHDILNTVTVLTGYAGLAIEEPAGPELKEYLQKIDAGAKKIQHQIEFTREYQEIGVNAASWQNVATVAGEAASEFNMDRIALEIDCGNFEIFADPLLRRVFYNFFDNAFRYAPPFTKISVSCKEAEDGNGLTVVFADDGAGIAEDVRVHLFESGFGNHTGLGLFLSREILAITDITITENGEAGKGACFEMTVPKGAYRFSCAGGGQE